MHVLGINAFGHDAAAVLLADGVPIFASSEERYDRRRHSAAWPSGAIAGALAHAGVKPRDVGAIAVPWARHMARGRKLLHVLRGLPQTRAYFSDAADATGTERRGYIAAMRSVERVAREAGFRCPVVRVPHHRSHAVSALLALPEAAPALVLTADGMGEWATAGLWHWDGRILRALKRAVYPHSPGKTYAAVTQWLGFVPEAQEGKTMGLAAYGAAATPGAAFARSLLCFDPRRLVRVDRERLDFPFGSARLYGKAFLDTLGPPRPPDSEIRPGDADVAHGIQAATLAFATEALRFGLTIQPVEQLAVAGGLFLNCAVNGDLARAFPLHGFHAFPVAGDAGAAHGAAAWVAHTQFDAPLVPLQTLFLGHEITRQEADALVDANCVATRAHESDELTERIVSALAAGAILGVARGRAEFGPRALGRRSVIALPTSTDVRDEVNRRKGREAWRPLAPMVRATDRRWFDGHAPDPYMIRTGVATEAAKAEVPGVVHADGTARVQSLDPGRHPLLHAVLDGLEARGLPPVLLNTSLNRRGEPIVNSAEEAYTAAAAMGLDALVLDARWIDLASSG